MQWTEVGRLWIDLILLLKIAFIKVFTNFQNPELILFPIGIAYEYIYIICKMPINNRNELITLSD